jgi:SWI/SNF-related matrix-associated actin-dependent regulator 1 of chromatin subfamily A
MQKFTVTKKLELMPHQKEAIAFAHSRRNSYLGLEPGLGKTPVAAVLAQSLGGPAVYISPPFLVQNVLSEFRRWAPELHVSVYPKLDFYRVTDVWIIPDSLIIRPIIMVHLRRYLGSEKGRLIIIDEAHRAKNSEAKRTRALLGFRNSPGIVDLFERQVYMSGTPMPNRPMELYSILSKAAPETIDHMSPWDFGIKYCNGHKNHFGWDFSGASNLKELRERVVAPSGPFMLRMRKDLLKLPEKIEEIFVLSKTMSSVLKGLESDIGRAYRSPSDLIKHQLAKKAGVNGDNIHVATYRRILGLEKVLPAVEYIKNLIDESQESFIVFAYHKEVIENLARAVSRFHQPLVITGDTPMKRRQELVAEFQNSKHRRIFIGNYHACGVGFTLTKASRVIFVEFDWVPGNNEQASDRAHRIGQNKTVFVQYMVYKDSLDKAIIEALLEKRKAIKHI